MEMLENVAESRYFPAGQTTLAAALSYRKERRTERLDSCCLDRIPFVVNRPLTISKKIDYWNSSVVRDQIHGAANLRQIVMHDVSIDHGRFDLLMPQ